MANNVTAQVTGNQAQLLNDVSTVDDARKALGIGSNYTATLNGGTVEMGASLDDMSFVAFSEKVKGNAKGKILINNPPAIVVVADEEVIINGKKMTKGEKSKLFKILAKQLGYEVD